MKSMIDKIVQTPEKVKVGDILELKTQKGDLELIVVVTGEPKPHNLNFAATVIHEKNSTWSRGDKATDFHLELWQRFNGTITYEN